MSLTAQSFTQACREGGALIEQWLRRVDREHGAAFYREAAAALRSWHAAEDVVQDAMVKVWLRCATFRGEGDPIAWIRQVVRHTLLDALRGRAPEQPLMDDDGDLTPQAAAAVARLSAETVPQPEQQLQAQQADQAFRQGYARFAAAHPEHAQVLRWVVDDGLDNAAIGALIERSPGATREFISQCRKKLRPFLADWHRLVGPAPASSSEPA